VGNGSRMSKQWEEKPQRLPTNLSLNLTGVKQSFPGRRIVQWNSQASSGMLRRVGLVRTDVQEELRASFNRVTRIGELGTTLAVTSNRRMLRRNTKTHTA
jgi:hypothetical protein